MPTSILPRLRVIVVAISVATLAACGSDHRRRDDSATATPLFTSTSAPSPTATPSPSDTLLRLPRLHAEPDPINGGRIVDAEGREILLRGVNVNALAEYWQGTAFPTTFPLTEADADLMAAIGWNTVRLLLSWSRVEPQPGVYDEGYLDTAAGAVRMLAQRGIYSIIDLHQDAWGPTLVARPEEECESNREPAFGWDGAPGWATVIDEEDDKRCVRVGVRETSFAVRAAFEGFWQNVAGPGGIGIRTRYVSMLAHIASRFANDDAVAGYDLMNEPNAFSVEQRTALAQLYGDALREIRAAEDAAGADPHLIFFEPSAAWSALYGETPTDFDRDRDVVYAPHLYKGGFDGGPATADMFDTARNEASEFGGAPVLSGEWGADPRRADDDSDGYFIDHQRLQDDYRIGATLWTWRESCGDPHKASDYRAGREPYVWGEFDVDCTSNTVTGVRTSLVEQLTRAYVRAAPGTLIQSTYDDASGAYTARGSAAAGIELLVFYPAARDGAPNFNVVGLVDARTHPAPGGNVYLVGRSTGGEWMLTIAE